MFPELTRDDVFRLETRRLWLRWPCAQDAAALAAIAADPRVCGPAADLPHPFPEGAAAELILTARRGNADGDRLSLAVTLKPRPDIAIGWISARLTDASAAELFFWLAPARWRNGVMSEAVRALADFLFGATSVRTLQAAVAPGAEAARRVCAKAGFARSASSAGTAHLDVLRLDRHAWSRVHGRRAADPENAMSVLRAGAGA